MSRKNTEKHAEIIHLNEEMTEDLKKRKERCLQFEKRADPDREIYAVNGDPDHVCLYDYLFCRASMMMKRIMDIETAGQGEMICDPEYTDRNTLLCKEAVWIMHDAFEEVIYTKKEWEDACEGDVLIEKISVCIDLIVSMLMSIRLEDSDFQRSSLYGACMELIGASAAYASIVRDVCERCESDEKKIERRHTLLKKSAAEKLMQFQKIYDLELDSMILMMCAVMESIVRRNYEIITYEMPDEEEEEMPDEDDESVDTVPRFS